MDTGLPDPDPVAARRLLVHVANNATGLYCSKIAAQYLEKLLDQGNGASTIIAARGTLGGMSGTIQVGLRSEKLKKPALGVIPFDRRPAASHARGAVMRGAVFAFAVLSPWFLSAWGSSGNGMIMDLDFSSGELIPSGLTHPETWICLGVRKAANGEPQEARWVKPIDMAPRDLVVGQSRAEAKAAYDQANRACGKPLELSLPPHSESFVYLDEKKEKAFNTPAATQLPPPLAGVNSPG